MQVTEEEINSPGSHRKCFSRSGNNYIENASMVKQTFPFPLVISIGS